MSKSTFSTGFYFIYWGNKSDWSTERELGDLTDGYSASELFVYPHFTSLKQEILESRYLSFKNWKEKVIQKAHSYYITEKGGNPDC